MNPLDLAIVLVSCDNYADLWTPFYTLFRRYWPKCPCKIYHISNYRCADQVGVIPLLVGKDISWSDNLISALEKVEEEYIFMFIDDLFLIDAVRVESIYELFAWIIEEKPDYVRLNPKPKPDLPYNSCVGFVSPGTIYRTGTVMSIWKKAVLNDLLKSGENAWEFELYGTERSDKYFKFYSTHHLLIPFVNGVIKGKWRRAAIKRLRSLEIDLQLDKREMMSVFETLIFHLQFMRSCALRLINPKYRRKVKRLLLGDKSNYSLLK